MTLQQKIQSKKGFTLVELVVVIAILAILAAIAIPAVIGIIGSANESQGTSDAATIDNACKTYYAGIVAGNINASNKGNVSADTLPAINASTQAKQSGANGASVQGALEYNGTWGTISGKLSDFGADKDGNIVYKQDAAKSGTIDKNNTWHATLAGATKLGKLYNK